VDLKGFQSEERVLVLAVELGLRRRLRRWPRSFLSLYRFLTGFFPFFFVLLGKISPTYMLSQIANKVLIFDGGVPHRKLRSRLA
jgi:hypothetical protein